MHVPLASFQCLLKCHLFFVWGAHLRPETHLTLNLVQAFLSFSYDFMFDRTMCVLVRIKVRGHLVMSIIQFMNLINVHFWTYLGEQGWRSGESTCLPPINVAGLRFPGSTSYMYVG